MMNRLMARALSQAASSSGPTKSTTRASYSILIHPQHSSYALYSTAPSTTSLKNLGFRKQKPQRYAPKSSSSMPFADPELGRALGAAEKAEPKLTASAKMGSSGTWPRPIEITWQEKVANSVNLTGTVQGPVHFGPADSDGKHYAYAVISQVAQPNAHGPLRIQVIFQGNLAHIAACHLKEKDRIHVGGQLSRLFNPGKILKDIQVT